MTAFQVDIVRYLHISDCKSINGVMRDYWQFCPACLGPRDGAGLEFLHRPKVSF